MNIKERINFYNSLATSSPVIYQKNKVPDTRFRLSEGIIKICGKYNIKPIILNNNSEDTNRNAAENTAYDDKNINFIDVDDRVSDNARGKDPKVKFTLHGAPKTFTSAYITNDLKDKIYNNGFRLSNNENIVNYLKSADEYALLLTIIATTTTSKVLRDNIINSVDSDISTDGSSSAGMSYSENRDELTTWINKHVKPEHKSKVDLLLSAPDRHAELKDKVYLSDMLLFSGKKTIPFKLKEIILNNTVVVKFNNTSLRLSHSRIDKINNASDKKTALQMGFLKKIQYICMNKGKRLSDLYDFTHDHKNGEKLFIQSNGRIQGKLTSVINKKMLRLKTVEIDNSETVAKELQKILKEKAINLQDNIFTKIVYFEDKEDTTGKTYYISKNFPPVYKPNIPYVHPENEQGASKYVVSKDDNFVALAPTKKEKFSTKNNFHDLKGLNSIKTGLVVAPDLMISHNAGICLIDHLNNNAPLPQSVFKIAVNELKKLHEIQGYLRDIKPANMAYDGKQVNFIDVDDRIKAHEITKISAPVFKIYGKEVIYTPKYITQGLVNNIYESNPGNPGKKTLKQTDITHDLQIADEYAFLMTMITATTKDNALKSSIKNAKVDIIGVRIINRIKNEIDQCSDRQKKDKLTDKLIETQKEYNNTGIMNKSNKTYFTPWLKENIKPKHHKSVKLLLTDPAKYADTAPKTHLADMLLFK